MKKTLIFLLTFFIVFQSCACAFSFKKQKSDPLDLKEKSEYVNPGFWARFEDEYLQSYICKAIENNHNARRASWQVEEYRQQVKYSLGQELPSLSTSPSYLGINFPNIGNNFDVSQNAFVLPFVASYEADIFLKNRDKTKSVKKTYESVKFDEKGIYIALVSDVATAYVNILQYDKLIKDQQKISKNALAQLGRDEKKFSRGVINKEQLNQSRSSYENKKSSLEKLTKERQEILNQFAVLIGESAQNSQNLQRGSIETFEYKGQIPDEISSDVIFSRPDVLSVEKKLEGAKINVKVARKELLPSFKINAIWAFNTLAQGSFFSWESSLAAILAGAYVDIFRGGRKIANLKIQKAKYEQLFEEYKQSSLNAVKEVSTALNIIKHNSAIDKNTIREFQLQRENYLMAQNKFKQGTISYTELLASEDNFLKYEQAKTQSKTTRLINYFTLYKAVGGSL